MNETDDDDQDVSQELPEAASASAV